MHAILPRALLATALFSSSCIVAPSDDTAADNRYAHLKNLSLEKPRGPTPFWEPGLWFEEGFKALCLYLLSNLGNCVGKSCDLSLKGCHQCSNLSS